MKSLSPHGYHPTSHTNCLWEHNKLPTKFCVCIDDFGIKYFADHLITTLKKYYNITTDWEGKNYCGLTFNWYYKDNNVNISMPDYINKLLQRTQNKSKTPKFSPHPHNQQIYRKHIQYAKPEDTSPKLDNKGNFFVQSILGSLLYYARAIESIFLTALN